MMVLRKLAVALLSAGVLLPGLSHALAVKELQTKSALGEPFRGEVELIELGDLTADEIKVNLASQEDFERMGIDKVYFLNDLKFDVVVNQGGRSFIRVTSTKPVVEPYLDFVVRIAWPGNARLQEVTALLDPPMLSDSAAPEVQAAVSSAPAAAPEPAAPVSEPETVAPEAPVEAAEAPQPVVSEAQPKPEPMPKPAAKPAPAPAPQPAAKVAEPAPKPQPAAADQYKVQAGDTMSGIAQQFRVEGASIPQTMIAIQRNNPRAFIQDNINQLKRGQVLRIPSEAQIREVSAQEALASVREQTAAWRAAAVTTAAPALAGAQVDATAKAPAPAAEQPSQSKAEMKLLGSEAGKAGAAAAGKEAGAAAKPEDARRLREIQAKTEAAQAQKQKLAGKVETLDSQIKANDKQMDVQNARLAELEEQLRQQQARKAETSKPAAPAEAAKPAPQVAEGKPAPEAPAVPAPAGGDAAAPSAAQEAPIAADAAAPAAQPPVAPKPAPVKPAPVVAEEPVEESGLLPMIVAGGAGLLALLGGGWWWNQRRRRQEEEEAAALDELEIGEESEPHLDLPEEGEPAAVATAQEESWDDSDWLGAAAPAAAAVATDRVLADPLEEAEQYIAYERYPQAASLLVKALEHSPERGDLRLKLLEVYAQLGDWDQFAQHEAWFESAGDLQAVSRAEELKAAAGGAGMAAAAAASDDFDFDFNDQPAKAGAAEEEIPSLEDLEMDFNASVSASSPALDTVKDSDLGDSDLSFDLDSFETDTAAAAGSAQDSGLGDLSFELDSASFDEPPATASPAAEAAEDFSLDEAEFSGGSSSSLGELEDFENLPDLEPVETAPAPAKAEDDGLSFGLDDLDFATEPTPAAAAESADELSLDDLEGDAADFSFDETVADEPAFEETVQLDSADQGAADDLGMDFDSAAAAEPEALAPVTGGDDLGMDDEFDFLADTDENATKLDLARAYIDMGDMEGARDILQEVLSEGSSTQKDEAKGLLAQVG